MNFEIIGEITEIEIIGCRQKDPGTRAVEPTVWRRTVAKVERRSASPSQKR